MLPADASYKFTTHDQDNDIDDNSNCAILYKGGSWYGACHLNNLNGLYLYGQASQPFGEGMVWSGFRGFEFSLMKSEMKLRPADL